MLPVHQESDFGVPIQRIVKLTIRPDAVAEFETLYYEVERLIFQQPGCEHVDLLRSTDQDNVFFTHSHWRSEEDLEHYRQSELFATTWPRVKALFAEPAEAWSVIMND